MLTATIDQTLYPEPDSFIPERWYSQPELVQNKKAFIPFLAGSYSCLGKNLALTELRTLTARVLMEYSVTFAPGEDGSRLLNKSKDHFTISLAPLDLVFTPTKEQHRASFSSADHTNFWSIGGARPEFGAWRGLRRDSCISRDIIPEEEALQSWTW